MLPHAYQAPAALLLLVGGLVACFAGYRLFRIVLGIYGFILGAFLASSTVGAASTAWMIAAALLGGIVGALIFILAYFVGVALIGAGIGALVANVIWGRLGTDPHPAIVILFAIVGAVAAMILQRYVIIAATAFAGAWTAILGLLALTGDQTAQRAARAADVWILYPTTLPSARQGWILIGWCVLSVIGVAVQLGITARRPT